MSNGSAAKSGEVIPAGQNQGQTLRSLGQAVQNLTDKLAKVVNDMSSLTVTTSTSEDMDDEGTTIKLQAKTIIKLDGDIEVIIPRGPQTEGGPERAGIDDQIWTIHSQMVEMAQEKRIEFIGMIADVAATLNRIRQ